MMQNQLLKSEAKALLKELISIPSMSREEGNAADCMAQWLERKGFSAERKGHNVWAHAPGDRTGKPVVLLNSHLDTVKPSSGYSRNPFDAAETQGRLYGLGSNDAGGSLVALAVAFTWLCAKPQPCHFVFAATAEEEVSGMHGVADVLPLLGDIALGVVGEPTGMQMAVAEKGLLVLDCYSRGKSGHAARHEGVNAIDLALPDVRWFQQHRFEKQSDWLGPVKMTVTQINAGTQHNVVPDLCHFVVDVRVNECYRNEELVQEIRKMVHCEVLPRSVRLNSSSIALDHPLVLRGLNMGLQTYGSPTCSDQALMPFPTLKIGTGDSARSHTADEFIFISEIEEAIDRYIALLDGLEL